MPKIRVNGVELNYVEYGQGKEIFVRSQSSAFSQGQISILSNFPPDYHFFMLDLARHYESDPGDRIFDIWSSDVYQFARELGLDKFIYWGTSHGGGIGFHLALAHPEALKGFVSEVGVPHDRSRPLPEMSTLRRRQREAGINTPGAREVVRTVLSTMFNPTSDPRRLALRNEYLDEAVEKYINRPVEDTTITVGTPFPDCKTNEQLAMRFSRIKVPTLLIVGAQDPQVSTEISLIALKNIPGAKAVFFQDEGHFITMESPEKLVPEIVLFVNQLNRSK
jgi:pimeloyl-ACP methyl ester carboxylesterase